MEEGPFQSSPLQSSLRNPSFPPNPYSTFSAARQWPVRHTSFKYNKLLPCSTKVRSVTRNLEVYVLPLIADAKKDDIFITCKTEKPDISQMPDNRRVIMLVGATGTGKATLINGMVNYLLQVEWKDKFRFEVIDDNDSIGQQKPNQITTYHLLDTEYLRVPYGVTIIYTPGFEDSGLLEADKASFSHLRNFFLNPDGIGRLDAIGFVTQSSQGRLTPTQEFIINGIRGIFGESVMDNFFLMTTFADAHKPPALDAVKRAGFDCKAHFKFNNSALFVDNTRNQAGGSLEETFWRMGMESFEEFFDHLGKVQRTHVFRNDEVLSKRRELQTVAQDLRNQIQNGVIRIQEFQQEEKTLKDYQREIQLSRDFTYQVKVQKQRVIDLRGRGIHTTNCIQCSYTCHERCHVPDNKEKYKCSSMQNGYCKYCPKKCKWDEHRNTPYHYEWYETVETRTVEDLRARYNIATTGRSQTLALMKSLEEDLKKTHHAVLQLIHQTKECLQRLNNIAFNPDTVSDTKYIDTLIQAEREQKKPGFAERIEVLQELHKEADLVAQMSKVDFDKYMKADYKEFFDQLKPEVLQSMQQQPNCILQ